MRRSAAPSASKTGYIAPRIYQNKPHVSSTKKTHALLSATKCDAPRPSSFVNRASPTHTPVPDIKRYEIVYAKKSSKKHKKWEEDGILEVSGVHAKIRSTSGKTISSASLKQTIANSIETGMILGLGGYECELISLLPDGEPSFEKIQQPVPDFTPISSITLPACKRSFSKRQATSSIDPGPDAFILPRPPNNHVWTQNPEGLPVTDVFLNGNFARKLHSFQLDGIKFLYECVMGFRKVETASNYQDVTSDVCGAILADEMGLGKSVQVIGLLAVLLKQGPYGGNPVIRRCLIVTPGSLVQNWRKEFQKWAGRENITTYCVSQDNPIRAYLSQMRPPPVIIMSYEMLLQHAERMAEMNQIDLVVCDEGHRLKNQDIKTTSVLKQISARRRILLTGTPIQNDLNEFWSLAEFVAPGSLAATREDYRSCIVNPLSRSRVAADLLRSLTNEREKPLLDDDDDDCQDSVVNDAANRLGRALKTFLLRRTSELVSQRLPEKVEQVVFCQASKFQRELESVLQRWMQNHLNIGCQSRSDYFDDTEDVFRPQEKFQSSLGGDSSEEDAFVDESEFETDVEKEGTAVLACIMVFRKLYNHPSLLVETINQNISKHLRLQSSATKPSLPRRLVEELSRILQSLPKSEVNGCHSSTCRTSGKLAVLQSVLKSITQLRPDPPPQGGNHRLVLVSNFTQTLDLLEPICQNITGAPCLRIDGKTPTKQRLKLVDRFNEPTCTERVLLLSSKAGGTGLNLIGANYLVLFDMDWNPSSDAQAVARIWREGQRRRVHLIRLVTADGLEERIFQRQVAKCALSSTALPQRSTSAARRLFVSAKSCGSLNKNGSLTRDELKELFQSAPENATSWTHDLLGCRCHLPVTEKPPDSLEADHHNDEEENSRVFQIGRGSRTKRPKVDEEGTGGALGASAVIGLGELSVWRHLLTSDGIAEALEPLIQLNCDQPVNIIRAVFQCHTAGRGDKTQ